MTYFSLCAATNTPQCVQKVHRLSLFIHVCVCVSLPLHILECLLLFLSGQILVFLVKAPVQFYYLNRGTGNQQANQAQNYSRSGFNQDLSLGQPPSNLLPSLPPLPRNKLIFQKACQYIYFGSLLGQNKSLPI